MMIPTAPAQRPPIKRAAQKFPPARRMLNKVKPPIINRDPCARLRIPMTPNVMDIPMASINRTMPKERPFSRFMINENIKSPYEEGETIGEREAPAPGPMPRAGRIDAFTS